MQIKKISTSITAGPKYKEKGNINVEINIVLKSKLFFFTSFKSSEVFKLFNIFIFFTFNLSIKYNPYIIMNL